MTGFEKGEDGISPKKKQEVSMEEITLKLLDKPLTVDEMELLLIPINECCKTIKDFERCLIHRNITQEMINWSFAKNMPICRFHNSDNKKLLKDT